jgi:cardiolipin synthase
MMHLHWITLLAIAEWTIRVLMTVVILRRQLSPATSLAWLAMTFLSPAGGLVVYLLIGRNRLGRRRSAQHRAVRDALRPAAGGPPAPPIRPQIEPATLPVVLQAEKIGGQAILGGNHVELLSDTQAMIDRLVGDIDAARHHVHLLFYIIANDATATRVADALIRAAARGVACRVLADAAGSRRFFRRHGLARRLHGAGVDARPALAVNSVRRMLARIDLRNHRKLAVIDGSVAYAGSQNIVDADYGRRSAGLWVDLTGRLTGPVVRELQTVFIEDWAFETDEELGGAGILPDLPPVGEMSAQVVATGPSHQAQALPRVLLTAIHSARRKIIITSPYLVPDEPTMLALAMAVDRGVEVDLVIPHHSDHPLVMAAGRAHYDRLLESGVDIYLYSHGLLHAKTMTIDDSFALLGSSNLDIRSFYLNFELNVLLYGEQITRELRVAQNRYIGDAQLLQRDVWRNRSRTRQLLDNAAALLSPLL